MTANWIIRAITGVHVHDYGCMLKAYRGDVARELRLYGEMHRFIPAIAADLGARIDELVVNEELEWWEFERETSRVGHQWFLGAVL